MLELVIVYVIVYIIVYIIGALIYRTIDSRFPSDTAENEEVTQHVEKMRV